jgi:hypothetical protein
MIELIRFSKELDLYDGVYGDFNEPGGREI